MGRDEPRAEQDIFNDLAELCAAPGFVHALAWMSLRDKAHFSIRRSSASLPKMSASA